MKICMIHGYRLDGTGSNIYVSNIARELVTKGHEVNIMCQANDADKLDFVDETYKLTGDNGSLEIISRKKTGYKGRCRVLVPDLGGTLLVYVFDKYEGFDEVITFQEASREKILDYIDSNIKALDTITANFETDLIHANHTIMQPYIACKVSNRRGIPYVVTVHGSALNFSVRNSSFLYCFALEGIQNARSITCVSKHNKEELIGYFKDKGDEVKKDPVVIPVGIDIGKFNIYGFKDEKEKQEDIKILARKLIKKARTSNGGLARREKRGLEEKLDSISTELPDVERIREYFEFHYHEYDASCPDRDIKDIISKIGFKDSNIILFVGKYIWTKGLQTIIAALPGIFNRYPDTEAVFVGFGQSRAILQSLVYCLSKGYTDLFIFLIKNHMYLDPGSSARTPDITKLFLEKLIKKREIEGYFSKAKGMGLEKKVHFTGVMSHDELSHLLPLADVFVAPSIFTEAFGTVAAEALACGVLPVITRDFGFKEVHENIYKKLGKDILSDMQPLSLGGCFVENLIENVNTILGFSERKDLDFRSRCHNIAVGSYSWEKVASEFENIYNALVG